MAGKKPPEKGWRVRVRMPGKDWETLAKLYSWKDAVTVQQDHRRRGCDSDLIPTHEDLPPPVLPAKKPPNGSGSLF